MALLPPSSAFGRQHSLNSAGPPPHDHTMLSSLVLHYTGKEPSLTLREWIQAPAPSGCVTSGKGLILTEPQFCIWRHRKSLLGLLMQWPAQSGCPQLCGVFPAFSAAGLLCSGSTRRMDLYFCLSRSVSVSAGQKPVPLATELRAKPAGVVFS